MFTDSLDSERIESVMSLSERCQVNLDDLVRSHMRYLFTSVQNRAELEQHVGKVVDDAVPYVSLH